MVSAFETFVLAWQVLGSACATPGSGEAIKSWKSYGTLPWGISGAMCAFNDSTQSIQILSPNDPYGRADFEFDIASLQFAANKYPQSNGLLIDVPMNNDFVTVDGTTYFIDIYPAKSVELDAAIMRGNQTLLMSLNWSLPIAYSQNPCMAKSNDSRYLFILGGASDQGSRYVDTFFIYDLMKSHSNALKGTGPALPYAFSQFGCVVSAQNYLYLIGGRYMHNGTSDSDPISFASPYIWSIHVADVASLIDGSVSWLKQEAHILPYAPSYPFVAEMNQLIYIIGGSTSSISAYDNRCSDETHFMRFNDLVATNLSQSHKTPPFELLRGPPLPKPLCFAAGIVANFDIFLFGGQDGDNVGGKVIMPTTWMKSNYAGPPTLHPTLQTIAPTQSPTQSPTDAPTHAPTDSPTHFPTKSPTGVPTHSPTEAPTEAPSNVPTDAPSRPPTKAPTNTPTDSPTDAPTATPSSPPTKSSPASMSSGHTSEYWIFMGLLISACIVLICLSVWWATKRWKESKQRYSTMRFFDVI